MNSSSPTASSASTASPGSLPASLVWLPRVLLAGIVGAALGTLVGCSAADDPQSSDPLPEQTWSTAGESSGSGSNAGTTSTTSTAATTSTGTASTGTTGTSTGTTGTSTTGTTGTTGTTTTTAPTTTADAGAASTACVQPTDEGNSAGVGKFCTTSSDCGPNLLCSAAFNAPAGATFCSLICATDADCGGDGATCFAAMGTHACVTAACEPLAATLF